MCSSKSYISHSNKFKNYIEVTHIKKIFFASILEEQANRYAVPYPWHRLTPQSALPRPVSVVVSSGVGGRAELSLAEVQCHLDREGASDLVIDLIMNATSDRIFQESILLAIALLEGGNTVIQVSRTLLVGDDIPLPLKGIFLPMIGRQLKCYMEWWTGGYME